MPFRQHPHAWEYMIDRGQFLLINANLVQKLTHEDSLYCRT
jgi:hypothetical protein